MAMSGSSFGSARPRSCSWRIDSAICCCDCWRCSFAHGSHLVVVARDLLDDAHDRRLVAVAHEMAADAFADPLARGGGGFGVEDDRVDGRLELFLDGLGDLAEDLLLGIEVVVEGPVREAGPLGDVGDAGLEEAVLLEDRLGRLEQPAAGLDPLARARPARLLAFDLRSCRQGQHPFLRASRTAASDSHTRPKSLHESTDQAPSRCSSSTPDGVPPPEVTTAVLASATWRSPASWRSWVIAS